LSVDAVHERWIHVAETHVAVRFAGAVGGCVSLVTVRPTLVDSLTSPLDPLIVSV